MGKIHYSVRKSRMYRRRPCPPIEVLLEVIKMPGVMEKILEQQRQAYIETQKKKGVKDALEIF